MSVQTVTPGWLLDEDRAMKEKLQGIQVQTISGGATPQARVRTVPVRFELPQAELDRLTFPLITVSLINMRRAPEREHRGTVFTHFATPQFATPQQAQTNEEMWGYKPFPIPYWLDYQITTYARDARVDRQLQVALKAADRLPDRFGYLNVPSDGSGTIRTLDVTGLQPADFLDEGGKRIFRKIHTVEVSSEMDYLTATTVANVLGIVLDIHYSDTATNLAHNG